MTSIIGSPWNSLEVVKLAVSVLTPIVLIILGIWVSRLARRLEQMQWANQTIIEWRIKIYARISQIDYQFDDLLG